MTRGRNVSNDAVLCGTRIVFDAVKNLSNLFVIMYLLLPLSRFCDSVCFVSIQTVKFTDFLWEIHTKIRVSYLVCQSVVINEQLSIVANVTISI